MCKNKCVNFGCVSFASIILGLVISVSFAQAEPAQKSYHHSSDTFIINISDSEQQETGEKTTGEEETEEYEFYIKGMTCDKCEVKVKEALLKCAGVKEVTTSYEDGYTVIEANSDKIDGDEIASAVKKAGFTIVEEE